MRELFIVILLIVSVALGWQLNEDTKTLDAERHKVAELTERMKTANLDLQERCSKQAQAEFVRGLWDTTNTSFTNHFNAKMNKCFMRIDNSDYKTIPGSLWVSAEVVDAFELKTYGEYAYKFGAATQLPFSCKVMPSGSNPATFCKSSDEFEAMVKQFME